MTDEGKRIWDKAVADLKRMQKETGLPLQKLDMEKRYEIMQSWLQESL